MEIFPEMTMTVAGLDHLSGITDPGRMAGDDERRPDPEVPARARRRTFTAQYKQEILAAYDAAPGGEKGAILRREGLYSSLITEWRRARDAGALAGLKQPRGRPAADPRDAQIARLTREKAKLEQELATSRFVVEVQAKLGGRSWRSSPRARTTSSGGRTDGSLSRGAAPRGRREESLRAARKGALELLPPKKTGSGQGTNTSTRAAQRAQ